MRQTVSNMVGTLPPQHFSVTVGGGLWVQPAHLPLAIIFCSCQRVPFTPAIRASSSACTLR